LGLIPVCLLLLGMSGMLTAQEPADRTARIDTFIQAEMKRLHIPGLALAIISQGEILYGKGYGLANLEHQVPVKPETVFQSGSTGKQYTAMAVLMLAEAGKLKLEESIRTYFPDAPKEWQPITIRHLLTHTSGLGDYTEAIDLRKDLTETELRQLIYRQKLGFKPGEDFSYSNLGYTTLGTLISKITGKFYGDFLQERIFGPLGMKTARIINESDIISNRAAGYFWNGVEWKNQEWVSPTFNSTADGSLYLTLADVAKWDAALYTEKLVSKASLDLAWTSGKLNSGKETRYGFGWSLAEMNGHRLIEHGGAWQGFMAMISRYIDDRVTVVLFANVAGVPVDRLAHAVAGLWEPALTPPTITAIEDKEPAVTALIKTRISELAAGTSKPEYFTKEFAAELFPEVVVQIKEYLGKLGPITRMVLFKRLEEGGVRVYHYQVHFSETRLILQMSLNKGNIIVGFSARPD